MVESSKAALSKSSISDVTNLLELKVFASLLLFVADGKAPKHLISMD